MEIFIGNCRYLVFGLLILFSNFDFSNTLAAQIILYPRGSLYDPIIYSGENGVLVNTKKLDFTCACITGLWAFYSPGHTGPILIAGGQQEYCLSLKQEISHLVLLSAPSGDSNANTLTVFDADMNEIKGSLEFENIVSYDVKQKLSIDLPAGYILTVGDMPYTLTRKSSEVCLISNKTEDTALYYCIFHNTMSLKENDDHIQVKPNCKENAKILYPILCDQYFKGFGFCAELEPLQPRNNYIKRSIDQKQRKLGRVFFGDSGSLKNYSLINETNFAYQEDYHISNFSHMNTSRQIRAQIFSYLIPYAETLLGLRETKPATYKTAAFRILDLCKEIAKAACPKFAVGDAFYDLTIGSFINVQSKVFRFEETFSDFATERRITDALNKCLQNITNEGPFPFLRMDRINSTYNETHKVCKKFSPNGYYRKFDTTLELNLLANNTGLYYEPIIDTSWQVISLAHSVCYGFFSAYNDHHHFLTIVMQMFNDKVLDLWRAEDSLEDDTKDIYGFVMATIREAVLGVADCTGYARLESAYPWDLIRPLKPLAATASV